MKIWYLPFVPRIDLSLEVSAASARIILWFSFTSFGLFFMSSRTHTEGMLGPFGLSVTIHNSELSDLDHADAIAEIARRDSEQTQ